MLNKLVDLRLSLKRLTEGIYTKEDVHVIAQSLLESDGIEEFEESAKALWEKSINEVQNNEFSYEANKKEAALFLMTIDKRKTLSLRSPFVRIAATIALLLSLSWGGYQLVEKLLINNVSFVEVKVPFGKKKSIELPDGSVITLNSGSSLRYPKRFYGHNRQIELDGEGFLNVTKNKMKPFIVKTRNLNVKVLGTSFNVKAYSTDEQAIVSVATGKVQVDVPEATLCILPNQQIVYDKKSGNVFKTDEVDNHANDWLKGTLFFRGIPIRSVVRELCRTYNRIIVFEDGTQFDDIIYGEHDNKSLESVLKSIYYATGISFRNENEKIILSRKEMKNKVKSISS